MIYLKRFNENGGTGWMSSSTESQIKDFCSKFNITVLDFHKRSYSVDYEDPISLLYFLEINADAMMEPSPVSGLTDIMDVDKYLPIREILNLEVGETYHIGMGADVKRMEDYSFIKGRVSNRNLSYIFVEFNRYMLKNGFRNGPDYYGKLSDDKLNIEVHLDNDRPSRDLDSIIDKMMKFPDLDFYCPNKNPNHYVSE